MLHDDHVFSDNLTEEELEKLLAELDEEESTADNSEENLVSEQNPELPKQPKSNQQNSKDSEEDDDSDDWITKLLEEDEADLVESPTDDVNTLETLSESSHTVAHTESDISLDATNILIDTSESDTALNSVETTLNDELDFELPDEANFRVESSNPSSQIDGVSQENLIVDDSIIDEEFEFDDNLKLSDDTLDKKKEEDLLEELFVDSNFMEIQEVTEDNVETATQEIEEKDSSDYDVDSFLDSSLLDNSYNDDTITQSSESVNENKDDLPSSSIESDIEQQIITDITDVDKNVILIQDDIAEDTQITNRLVDSASSIESAALNSEPETKTEIQDNPVLTTKYSPHLDALLKPSEEEKVERLESDDVHEYKGLDSEAQFLKLSARSQDTARQIQTYVKEMKMHIRQIQDSFRTLTDNSAEMIAETRQLQNMCKDDFSVTYEQMHQLRSQIIQSCSDIDGIPSKLDIVEEAMESDLYVAETRTIKNN